MTNPVHDQLLPLALDFRQHWFQSSLYNQIARVLENRATDLIRSPVALVVSWEVQDRVWYLGRLQMRNP